MNPATATPADAPLRLLRRLNLFGLDYLDPIVLAALADERPLLLIGPHGTAKSELLNRLAAALALEHRHYNASMISFDDLLGYPVPDTAGGTIRYLRTPGDLWDAQSVFLDEISRCRPETQNKLFSVVHEKRVQGLALPNLRYRWAAMNPPLTVDSDPDEAYEGSLPLDAALADRFAYVVVLPSLMELPAEERVTLIRHGGARPESSPDVAALVARTRAEIAATDEATLAWAANYVDALVQPLADAKLAISGRRAGMLAAGFASISAAARVLGRPLERADCALATLRAGVPQRAQGRLLEFAKMQAIHRAALAAADEAQDRPLMRLRALTDPVLRVAEGLRLYGRGVDRTELSTLVSEAFALLPEPRRFLFARHVLPLAAARDCLNAPALELLAAPVVRVAEVCAQREHSLTTARSSMQRWNALAKKLAQLARGDADDVELGNVLLTVAVAERQEFDADALVALDREWRDLFAASADAREAA